MYTLTIKKNEEKKINFYHFVDESGEEVVKKAMDCAQVFIRKVGLDNIKFDLSDRRQCTLYGKFKTVPTGTTSNTVEEPKVKVTSSNKPLEEVKVMGSVEAVSSSRVFTTDEGDTITVVVG